MEVERLRQHRQRPVGDTIRQRWLGEVPPIAANNRSSAKDSELIAMPVKAVRRTSMNGRLFNAHLCKIFSCNCQTNGQTC